MSKVVLITGGSLNREGHWSFLHHKALLSMELAETQRC
jgi:hypothetical protein